MGEIVVALLGVAIEALKLVNSQNAMKYVDETIDLQKKIAKEEAKGFDSDDAKIEAWYKELKIIAQAAQAEILAYANSKK